MTVGVAITGETIVTVLSQSRYSTLAIKQTDVATTLAASVNAMCGQPGTQTCAGPPTVHPAAPLVIGDPAGLLSLVDLPPVARARGPWVGTKPARSSENFAGTTCDRTQFNGKGISRQLSRTFLFPQARKADRFALNQTAAVMAPKRGKKFVEEVRQRIRRCATANLGTDVTLLTSRSTKKQEITVWALTVEVSDKRSVVFFMSIMRNDKVVSQVGFSPHDAMTMSRADFVALSRRALERLPYLPGA